MGTVANGRGRPRGQPNGREEILAAAAELFRDNGFETTSLRAIARRAGCDPKLVRHYFVSKQQVFVEALHIGVDTAAMIKYILDKGLSCVGIRFITALTAVYESPAGARMVVLLRSDPQLKAALWTMISARLESLAAELLPGTRSERTCTVARLRAVSTGFIETRYLGAAALPDSLPREQAVACYGNLVQLVVDAHMVQAGRAFRIG